MAYEDYHVNADDVKLDGDPNIRRTVPPSPSGGGGGIAYGTCTTAANVAVKAVTLTDATGWELKQGATICIKFTDTNTAQNPTLNVNNSGAKSIYYNRALITTGSLWVAGENDRYTTFIYDGTYWVWIGSSIDRNTTYSNMSTAELTAGTATASRVVRADYLKSAILDLANPIGTVIESTTCDTMAKVVAAYGGTTWIQHSGYMLRGATSSVVANQASNDGGADSVSYTPAGSANNHTLTIDQIPSHNHRNHGGANEWVGNTYYSSCYGMANTGQKPYVSLGTGNISNGGGKAHNHGFTGTQANINTLPKYKNVYIWERTA